MFRAPPDKGERTHIAVRLIIEFPTVIIIYSDDATRASMRFLLEVEGWEVCDFKSPAELPENPSPGCLVLEQDLPGMAGLELVEELRNRGMTLPVVFTTAQQDAGFLARATAAGANTVDSLSPTDVIGAISATIAGAVTRQPDQAGRANT
jgi:two-component system, LuxR family, response regulator FixJ